MINIKIFIVTSLFVSLVPLKISAMTLDQDYLTNFVKSFIEKNIVPPVEGKMEVDVANIDPRIIIKPCISSLKANIPENHNGRNLNVKIYCEDPLSWQMYIPVKISTVIPILVASTTLSKGTVLNDNNTFIEYRNISHIRGEFLRDINQVFGARSTRDLSTGSLISPRNVCLVCKGEKVIIEAMSNTFTIKTAGIALNNGSIGEQVNVRNQKSGRTVTARVKTINKVVIN